MRFASVLHVGSPMAVAIDGDRVELDYDELGPGRVQVEFGRPGEADPVLDGARAGNGGSQDGH